MHVLRLRTYTDAHDCFFRVRKYSLVYNDGNALAAMRASSSPRHISTHDALSGTVCGSCFIIHEKQSFVCSIGNLLL